MEQAALMQYDDDFDEEVIFSGAYTGKSKYQVQLKKDKPRSNSNSA